jgi:fructose-1,6-bisphosphatase I
MQMRKFEMQPSIIFFVQYHTVGITLFILNDIALQMNINRQVQTLDEFTIQQVRDFPTATGQLSNLFRDIGLAAKRVNLEVNKAGLVDILGDAGSVNVQGEDVKKLDVFANNQFIGVLKHGISCAGVGSEENDDIVVFDDEKSNIPSMAAET